MNLGIWFARWRPSCVLLCPISASTPPDLGVVSKCISTTYGRLICLGPGIVSVRPDSKWRRSIVISSRYKSGSPIGRTMHRPFSLRKTAVAEIRAEADRRPGVSARSSVATVHGKRAVCGLRGPGCPRPASPSVREETFARGLTTRPGYKRSMYRYHWREQKNGLWAWDHCYGS